MSKYAVAHWWGHILPDPSTGKDREFGTRFVADLGTGKLIAAQIQWNTMGTFEPASAEEMADIEESVVDANDALNQPADFELEMTDDLPAWAAEMLPATPGPSI